MLTKPTCARRSAAGALALLIVGAVASAGQEAAYHDHEALTAELRSLVDASSSATLRSIGTSREGRDVWLVEIGDDGGAPLEERPGLLVVANLEGDHLVGSELALATIRHLISDESAAEIREDQVVYVVPRLNPDGAEAFFAAVRWDRRGNATPYDDDNDGRVDEDPGEDLDGDGLVTVMRVEDPEGPYRIDGDDPRLMKRADRAAGESGGYRLYREGRDDDGDGFYNEDGAGGVDLNRNFQHAYAYWQADAGVHMVSEAETRALMDFVVGHRNIAAILTYGHSDNLATSLSSDGSLASFTTVSLTDLASESNADVFEVGDFSRPQGGFGRFGGGRFFRGGRGGGLPRLRGAQPGRDNDPSSGRRPSTTVHADDRPYFEEVAEAYREITGISETLLRREPKGAFFQFGYFQFGVPSFSTPGWGFAASEDEGEGEDEADAEAGGEEGAAVAPARRPRGGGPPPGTARGGRRGAGPGGARGGRGGGPGGPGPSSAGTPIDAKLLAGFDSAGIEGFVDWTPYDHPQLGRVEIGGFVPYASTNPPAERLAELGEQHAEFAVKLASMLPRLRIVDTEVTDHGGGVFTVSATIENSGYFPTSLEHGVVSRSVDPTMIQIQVPPEALLTGSDKTTTFGKLDGSGAREKATWVLRGRRGEEVEILARSQKGGSDTATVELR